MRYKVLPAWLVIGVSVKRSSLRAESGPKSAFSGVLGEFCTGWGREGCVLGEFCTGIARRGRVPGEFCTGWAAGAACWESFVP